VQVHDNIYMQMCPMVNVSFFIDAIMMQWILNYR